MTDSLGTAPGQLHPVDAVPPPARLLVLGIQHVLVMYAGAVAVPLIVGRALNLPPEQVAFLVSADLFACVAPMLAMIAAGAGAGADPSLTLRTIYGAVIGAGLFGFFAAGLVGRLARFFPPVVTGTVILVIGITLMRIGVDWAAGGQA